MKSFVNLFRGRRGEVATILTLISVVLMLAGVSVGSFVAQKETKTQSKAADSVKVRAQDISNYCLGDTGEEGKVATTLCLAWGQGNGKSVGPHYCCDECNESQAGVWTNTCYRPNSQSTNYRGPCNSDAGVAFPLVCTKDPTDNKWKWVSQNHYGECNVVCSTTASSIPTATPGSGQPTATSTPRVGEPQPTATPVINATNTPIPPSGPTNTPLPPGYPTNTPTPTVLLVNSPTPTPTTASSIYIFESSFKPGVLTVKPNTTVEWKNLETTSHTVSASSSTSGILFDSGTIPYNGTFRFTFTSPGNYNYYSKMKPQMTGTIIV